MSHAPLVIVTATTETLRDRSRVRVNEAYTNALAAFGVVPLVLPPIDCSLALDALGGASGLVLTGGEDVDPKHFGEGRHAATGPIHDGRDAFELALSRAAAERRVPTLAICRGAQVLNVALGGSLVQDIPSQLATSTEHDVSSRRAERVHEVTIDANARLARIVGDTVIRVNSSHHQSVNKPAPSLRVTARSDDGVIEALESTDAEWWMIAVQWHPEELTATQEGWDRHLFAAFADAARAGGRGQSRIEQAQHADDDAPSTAQVTNRQRASSRT